MRKNDGRGRRTGTRTAERDEVERLLREAEDEAVLSLSVDAHHITASSESDYLHPDLHRRFQALKSSTAAAAASASAASKNKPKAKGKVEECCEGGDLCDRFAALKASIPPQSHHRPLLELVDQPSAAGLEVIVDADITEEDEVAKVIQWAMDAARLDPSSPPPHNLPTTSSRGDISITTSSSSESESENESEGQSQSQDEEEDRTTADAAKRGAR